MATYPTGTNVREIDSFDRGQKVVFGCKEHPGPEYRSKDPFVSQWFPANQEAINIHNGHPDPCRHTLRHDVWVTTAEYTPNV